MWPFNLIQAKNKAEQLNQEIAWTIGCGVNEVANQVHLLMQEYREAHALLTGRWETVWCMTHEDNKPSTELGKAVFRLKNGYVHILANCSDLPDLKKERFRKIIAYATERNEIL